MYFFLNMYSFLKIYFQKKNIYLIFLFKKKKSFFFKLKWAFNQNNIIKHQLVSLYGKSLTKLTKRKLILDNFFFNILTFLELRLSTLVLRMFFFFNFFEVNKEICSGNITVCQKKKHKNFLVRINSIIRHSVKNKKVNSLFKILPKCLITIVRFWRWKKWKKWKRINRKRKKRNTGIDIKQPRVFKKIKFNAILNYIEIFYKIKTGVILYKPVLGEILLVNKKRMLSFRLVKSVIIFI